MSVRQSLLAILDQGPCYGYQLRHEFDRRTGSRWPLNVGQIYNTLERLERDGLVARLDADTQGHIYWRITDAGSAEVSRWLSSPVVRTAAVRDEVAIKIAIAATLPGVDARAAIRAQRIETSRHLAGLRTEAATVDHGADAEQFARALVMDSLIFAAEAEERWLAHLDDRLAAHPRQALGLGLGLALTQERPKRGRPAKSAADAVPV